MFGIIVASHGEYACAALKSVEMIADKQDNVLAYALTEQMSLSQLQEKITEGLNELNSKCDFVVALCDIYGGTPFNTLTKLKTMGFDFEGYAGFNMPILIDLSLSRELTREEIHARINETHSISLAQINVVEAQINDESDL